MPFAVPENEAQRLETLHNYGILDTPPEAIFDEITSLAAEICGTPIALLSLIDEKRQWIKSKVGLDVEETPRDHAFCAHALVSSDLMLVSDATLDARFALNPLVTGEPGIRFYAGAPLISPQGVTLGALCVIDRAPRQLTELQLRSLGVLSRQVITQMQLRREVVQLRETKSALLQSITEKERAEADLRRSELEQRLLAERLTAAQEAAKVGSWCLDLATFQAEWSEQTHRIFGSSALTFSPSYQNFLSLVHPEDRELVDETFHRSLSGSGSGSVTHRFLPADGGQRYIEHHWQISVDAGGVARRAIGTSQDVTERLEKEQKLRRINRLYAVSSGINQAIIRISDTQAMYEEACRLAVEEGELVMAWVGLADRERRTMKSVALQGKDAGYLESVRISLDTEPLGMGPTGTAFRENRVDFCNDIAHDPRMAPWREEALQRGYRSSATFPLRVDGQAVGVYTVYSITPHYFNEEERALLDGIAENISFAIEARQQEEKRRRSEAALQQSEASMALAQSVGHFGSWQLSLENLEEPEANPLRWSDEMCRMAGDAPGTGHACMKSFFHRIHPHDVGLVRRSIAEAIGSGVQQSFEHRICRSDGTERIICQTVRVFDGPESEARKLIGAAQDVTEQRRSEGALHDSDERFRAFMTHSPVAGWIMDDNNRFRYVSPGYYRVFGVVADALEGRSAHELYETHLADIYVQTNQQVVKEQKAVECISPGLRRDGSPGEFLVVKFPIPTADGSVLVGGLALDVTESRQAENSLRESEARFRRYFELPLHGIAITSPDKGWIQVNDQLCAILGYSREELKHLTWAEISYPDDLNADLIQFNKLLAGRIEQYEMEKRFVRKDGLAVWTHIAVGCVRKHDASLSYVIGVMSDISARKQAEESLREHATLLDKAQDAIIVRDLTDKVTYWNKGAERIYGWTAREATGQTIKHLLNPEPAVVARAKEETFAKGEWQGEIRKMTKAGKHVEIEGRWTLVRDRKGKPKSILSINTDVTERKKLERQFLRAQRVESIGALAGGIAHDLNNVLAPILMAIEYLKLHEREPKRQQVLSNIESSASRGALMVKQVLSFARGMGEEQMVLGVGHLLKDICKISEETFLKTIQVRCDVGAQIWPVRGDPTQIHQVLLNLCVNARDAMPHGGVLALSASNIFVDQQYARQIDGAKFGPYVVIEVEDTGVGMTADVMERVFEPFFTTKEIGKGTGLGLSSSDAIVKRHGGFMRVYSEHGRGTRFRVYLPACNEEKREQASVVRPTLPMGQGELILVIDDEAGIREILRETLEAFGYRALLAYDGADCVSLYSERKEEIALVLTDMMMPMMDGRAVIQILKRMNPAVRIVAVSGLHANGMGVHAADAGVDAFLPKPFTAEQLLSVLAGVLRPHEAVA